MTAKDSGQSPLARLVLVMFCLAVAGSFIAGLHYVAIDLPAQQHIQPPDNGRNPCRDACIGKWIECKDNPPVEYHDPELQCMNALGKCYKDECGL